MSVPDMAQYRYARTGHHVAKSHRVPSLSPPSLRLPGSTLVAAYPTSVPQISVSSIPYLITAHRVGSWRSMSQYPTVE
eukprot:1115711-Rhodomonas_salina.7